VIYYDELFKKTCQATVLDRGRPAVIYGAGRMGRLVADILLKQGIRVAAFLDRQPSVKEINGTPVLRVTDNTLDAKKYQAIVAVFNFQKGSDFTGIKDLLNKLGFETVISFEAFYHNFADFMAESYFWLTRSSFYRPYKKDIEQADGLWKDEKSRQLYRSLIEHRLTLSFDVLLGPEDAKTQYLPPDVPLPKPPYCFIDLGAFDGDTIDCFVRNKIPLTQVIAFEPDRKNFQRLVERVRGYKNLFNISLFPLGVGENFAALALSCDGRSSACHLPADKGKENFEQAYIVALDDILHGVAPNYIKMDIEGFEKEALLGMRQLVEHYRPALAVSLYHRPEDLFVLPLLLSSWNYPASFYLRTYGEHTLETVLYAVPDTRRPVSQ
jgi:FkbM family methyltransferase